MQRTQLPFRSGQDTQKIMQNQLVLPHYTAQKKSDSIAKLFSVVGEGDVHKLKQIVVETKIPLNVTNADGQTLINFVMELNDKMSPVQKLEMIMYLTENGVSIASNSSGITPLHVVATYQNAEMAKHLRLYRLGNVCDNRNMSPLHYFVMGKQLTEVRKFMRKKIINPFQQTTNAIFDVLRLANAEQVIKDIVGKIKFSQAEADEAKRDSIAKFVTKLIDTYSTDDASKQTNIFDTFVKSIPQLVDDVIKSVNKLNFGKMHFDDNGTKIQKTITNVFYVNNATFTLWTLNEFCTDYATALKNYLKFAFNPDFIGYVCGNYAYYALYHYLYMNTVFFFLGLSNYVCLLITVLGKETDNGKA
jgi:hypothetical protein